jgi:hypothetical protein
MASSIAATLFAICVLIATAGVLWFHIVRPILEDFGIIRDAEPVNDYQEPTVVMSPAPVQTAQTDGQTDYVSEADRWLDRLEVDRTKTAVIELMVYSGWTVGDVRAVVKGDNAAIGAEVAAARERLGMSEPPRPLRVRDETGERVIAI